MVLSTEWSQVEVIDLVNDGNGIGFILVGGRSTGVVIKALTPGGVAERDGRLQCGDHVLQIGDVNLRGFSSEQVATVLRQTGAHVRLIVARSVESSASEYQTLASHAPIIPTKLLSDPDELTRQLYRNPAISTSAGCFIPSPDTELPDFPLPPIPTDIVPSSTSSHRVCPKHLDIVPMCGNYAGTSDRDKNVIDMPGTTVLQVSAMMSNYVDTPETVTYEVELRKNVYGLGITVAGYVCEEEELSGIFVKSIIEGSAAEMSRKIQINDRIVAVDGKTLAGVTNHQAVEILRNTDIIVHLTLERFLRGRKYEHLQVALIEAKGDTQSQISLPASPSIATLSWVAAKSDADSIATDEMMEVPIECELASHTTLDSNMSMVLDNSENDDSGQSSPGENGIEETQLNDEIQICIINGNANGNGKDTSRTPSVGDSPSRLNTPTPTPSLDSLQAAWKSECPDSEIIVAEINKLSGLGFSLEGTVDVECGIELRPHHYIRSILEDGPVGKQGIFKPGDELLQVNEHKLQGLMHTEVVKILKELPGQVKLVCGRGPSAPSIINTSQNAEAFESRSLLTGGHQSLQGLLTKAQSESSLYTSSTATLTDQQRSKSVENISGLALWCTDVTYIDIEKTERGFGFSVLDYQDPLDSEGTVIVIRGLIPGGSAEATNQIFPGDRLVSVAENSLHGLTLDEAVSILKGTTPGIIKIGICRPLSTSDNNIASPPDTPST